MQFTKYKCCKEYSLKKMEYDTSSSWNKTLLDQSEQEKIVGALAYNTNKNVLTRMEPLCTFKQESPRYCLGQTQLHLQDSSRNSSTRWQLRNINIATDSLSILRNPYK